MPLEVFWLAVPVALVVAAGGASVRTGLAWGTSVLVVAALLARPPGAAAIPAAALCLLVLAGLRARLERERDRMREFALRDPLTGLANRRALDDRLRLEVARHVRQGDRFTVLALDLDGFKAVNDRFGHETGDEVLREVAGALRGAVRAQDAVARLGGDEFCVVAPQTGREGARRLTARILAALAGVTAGVSGLSASTGAAVFPDDADEAGGLLAVADAAALEAKRRRKAQRRAA